MSKAIEEVYAALKRSFKGALLRPDDAEYPDARRIWNGLVARRPGLIARCSDRSDVQAAVRAATSAGVITAVRCGGHSLAGFSSCDDGLVIDLSPMRRVQVYPEARSARFEGGCHLGSIDSATQTVGLAFPAGVVSHTGAAGLVLGGGTGWLNRLHGLSCDNVRGFTVVVADGTLVRANVGENADLFWALRGGGGNFGVVTEFEVTLHPVSSVLFGRGLCPGDEVLGLLRDWREFMPEAPDNLRWGFSLKTASHDENIPTHQRGHPIASTSALWVGDLEEGRRYIDHAFAIGNHRAVTKEALSFATLQTLADSDFPHGRRYYTKAGYFKTLNDESIGIMLEALATNPSARNEIELAYLGGAAARVAPGETAFGDRSAPFVLNVLGNWSDSADDAANISWIRSLFARLRPSMVPGVYVNFMSGDENDRVPEAYRERWERLRAIKTIYDPTNFFRLNQNIPPMAAEATGIVR
jgi:FAD binding domain-containing protein/berberine-like enzyme